MAILFDGDHFDNHLHGSATNDADSGRLQLLLAITEEANRNGKKIVSFLTFNIGVRVR